MRISRIGTAIPLLILYGCGGPDLGGANRGSSFDQGLSGNYSSYGNNNLRGAPLAGVSGRGTYPKIETSFELPDVKGNPFDYAENDVLVTIQRPDNRSVKIPAFFDGGPANKTWRVRYTPDTAGRHAVTRVSLNGRDVQPDKLEKREMEAAGSPGPGFIRRDPKEKTRFAFDNGNSYYPIGHNIGSGEKTTELSAALERMSKNGENWSRLDSYAGSGLDASASKEKRTPAGQIDLEAARKWDVLLEAADKSGVYLQLILQREGPLSTRLGSGWESNPWNKKNGGFLSTPDEYFSSPRAVALTKAAYRYLIARFGYSPSILAWELMDQVELTDAVAHKHSDEVAAWHNEMTGFLRQQDPYRHLVTSGAGINLPALGTGLDYWELQASTSDPISTISAVDTHKLDRPVLMSELATEGGKAEAGWVRRALWAGLASDLAGTPSISVSGSSESESLSSEFRAVADFVKMSGLASRHGLIPLAPSIESTDRGPLTLSPGSARGQAKRTEFTVLPSGDVDGIAEMPAYLQGSANRSLFPSASFKANFASAGTFSVSVGRASHSGAGLQILVDGSVAAEKSYKQASTDTDVEATVEAKVPAGEHTIRIENPGADWLMIRRITLSPCAPAVGAVGKSSKDYATFLLFNRLNGKETKAKVTIPGLQAGAYRVEWWDTSTGKQLSEETVNGAASGLALNTPSISGDIAVTVSRTNDKSASRPARDREKKGKSEAGATLH